MWGEEWRYSMRITANASLWEGKGRESTEHLRWKAGTYVCFSEVISAGLGIGPPERVGSVLSFTLPSEMLCGMFGRGRRLLLCLGFCLVLSFLTGSFLRKGFIMGVLTHFSAHPKNSSQGNLPVYTHFGWDYLIKTPACASDIVSYWIFCSVSCWETKPKPLLG